MATKPFLKWAGGKRWLVEKATLDFPQYSGRYLEPFLGGAAVFFHLQPRNAILSDLNEQLIETYQALKDDWRLVQRYLREHQKYHSEKYYYRVRHSAPRSRFTRAALFLYLNRSCWNGLYRVNRQGQFNVPKGTKTAIILPEDDFEAVAASLANATLMTADFATCIEMAEAGDLLFVDPPYTTAHNFNGFIKYNQTIFSWDDQLRLRDCLVAAVKRGANVILTNAAHESIRQLYASIADEMHIISRLSVISGQNHGRGPANEFVIRMASQK
jgi:DNA adenine methylase